MEAKEVAEIEGAMAEMDMAAARSAVATVAAREVAASAAASAAARAAARGRKYPAHSGRFQLGQDPSVTCACCVQVPADLGMRRTECCHVEQIGGIARDQLLARPKLVQLRRQPLPATSHAPTPRCSAMRVAHDRAARH